MNGIAYYYTDPAYIEFIATSGEPQNYPWHMHTRHWILGVTLSGTVALTAGAGAGVRLMRGGQHFCIRPYEPHSMRVAPESSLFVCCLEAAEDFAAKADILQTLLLRLPLLTGQEQVLELLARNLPLACAEAALCGTFCCQDFLATPESCASHSIQSVLLRMLDNADAFSGIEHMAAYAGYSRWHFLRTFQKHTGMTPHAFQLLCRLRLLRGLLRTDTASAVAAASAGFFDQSHMHKVFKRHHGMTPGQFKRANFRLEL